MTHSFLSSFDERRLLVVDLDGILIDDQVQDQQALSAALQDVRDSLILVYVSGRRVAEQVEAVERHELLLPDYVVSAVGTEVYRMPGEHPLDEWERYIAAGFDREEIVRYLAEHAPRLKLQPAANQTPLKVSYLLRNAQPQELDALQRQLAQTELAVKVVYSHDLYLDIIPERAGIGAAVKFLVDSLLLFPNQVFVCGDSGNDIDLFQYGFRGIVVANASHELKKAVELRAYFSHEPYAAGVLEGLQHYNFFGDRPPIRPGPNRRDLAREAFDHAVASLRRNLTPLGFSAAGLAENPLAGGESNYFAVWSRDGIKTGLWSLGLNDPDVNECFRRTLCLLAEHQT
ncbi:MAG TPA: HAD-IIB family hydrolase, partial [Candidatus Binatia bacterium]|nr:HAD-IIB family hydrolase [Candidatus Binatia bacterium]